MEFLIKIKPYWHIISTVFGFAIALLITIRYKIPDLTRRIEAIEKKGAYSKDIKLAIDGFSTVCKFNQATCQKSQDHLWMSRMKKFDEKHDVLLEKLNSLAISNANLVAKVELLITDRNRNPKS